MFASGCSEVAMLMSGSGLAASQNMYVKVYNGVDVLTIIGTKKSIKQHVYEEGKKYIIKGEYDEKGVRPLASIEEKHPSNYMD
jgi:hypothetical protein